MTVLQSPALDVELGREERVPEVGDGETLYVSYGLRSELSFGDEDRALKALFAQD